MKYYHVVQFHGIFETKKCIISQHFCAGSNFTTDIFNIYFSPILLEVGKLCKNSSQLLDMSLNDLDIKLGIKNNLHRKKLFLALRAKNPECQGPEKFIMNLESHWIVSWLDDIGLPQYKERFLEAKIDVIKVFFKHFGY